MKKSKNHLEYFIVGGLAVMTIISGFLLSSIKISASQKLRTASVTVPTSCTLSASLDTAHAATLINGTYSAASGSDYANGIGKTTLAAFCNDYDGFSIYAVGYTNNTHGNNTLIGQSTGQTINTAVYNSGDLTSSWSMKLTKITDATVSYIPNNLTITNSFDSYHTVPSEYVKVAEYHASTGSSATDIVLGSKLETTYAAYISQTQPPDTYVGQVKYVLVHPYDNGAPAKENEVVINYDGDGAVFANSTTKNRVVYEKDCLTEYAYVGDLASISKTSNVGNDGTKNGSFSTNTYVLDTVTVPGADRLKVVLTYDISENGDTSIGYVGFINEAVSSYSDWFSENSGNWCDSWTCLYGEGEETFILEGDTVTFDFEAWGTVDENHDYGYYAKIYPVYDTETSGAVNEVLSESCSVIAKTGNYSVPDRWYGSWYADINRRHYDFEDESDLIAFLADNFSSLSGNTITLYRGRTFAEAYENANKPQTDGYYVMQDLNGSMCQTIAITQDQTLLDNRDDDTYLIRKLKDGNCWMLDNLRLDPTDSLTAANMSENNTNATNTMIANYLNNVMNVTSTWSGDGAYLEPWVNSAFKDRTAKITSYGDGSGKVGVYYNYCAATVGTYCYESGAGVDIPGTIIDAPYDLCPANWRMPTGGGTGEYQILYNKYNTTTVATNPASLQYNLSTPLAGFFQDMSTVFGDYGFFWSSTYGVGYDIYRLIVDPNNVYPLNYFGYRSYGYSMRCLVAQ